MPIDKEKKKKVNPDGSVVGYTPPGHTIVDSQGNQISVTRSQFEDYNRKQGQDYVNAKLAAKGQAAAARTQGVTPAQGADLQQTQDLSLNPVVRAQQEQQLASEQTAQTLNEEGALKPQTPGEQFDASVSPGRMNFSDVSARDIILNPKAALGGIAVSALSQSETGRAALSAAFPYLSQKELQQAMELNPQDSERFIKDIQNASIRRANRSAMESAEAVLGSLFESNPISKGITRYLSKVGLAPKTPTVKIEELLKTFSKLNENAQTQVDVAKTDPQEAFKQLDEYDKRINAAAADIYFLIRESEYLKSHPEEIEAIEDELYSLRSTVSKARELSAYNTYQLGIGATTFEQQQTVSKLRKNI